MVIMYDNNKSGLRPAYEDASTRVSTGGYFFKIVLSTVFSCDCALDHEAAFSRNSEVMVPDESRPRRRMHASSDAPLAKEVSVDEFLQ